jgi:hypothetical protein
MDELSLPIQIHRDQAEEFLEWCEDHNCTAQRIIRSLEANYDDIYRLECFDKNTVLLAKIRWGTAPDFHALVKALTVSKPKSA